MSVNITEIFGSNVFSTDVMRERLPKGVFREVMDVMENGGNISIETADIVANAMKDWAVEKGATHYTHWFQPLTGITAEKHDSFLTRPENSRTLLQLTGKQLIMGESDASSFPSGGLRSTHYARGYTAWDMTSPAFVKEMTAGTILCIPTIFVSYHGEALDKKTPLLRSMNALSNQAIRVLKLFGKDVDYVSTTVGPEQEYFLIKKEDYEARQDLILTGRTLFGAPSAKGQELEEHYFGVIRPEVSAFMKELDEELWKLGIPAKTKHNEVAPCQHELAPIFDTTNVAIDHNLLTMEMMKKLAPKYGLVCLQHEKPFEGVNGSGKHNNWSLSTDTGVNLLSPGETPHENAQFLLFLAAVIQAVDDYQGLLRASVATAGNDHRLGANEAPPAIISMFLGDELTEILEAIENSTDYSQKDKTEMKVGVHILPRFPKDTTDRNRTSPFAFTGNKFEFRMLGSKSSISGPNIVLNTIVAEAFKEAADMLEKAEDFDMAVHDFIKETLAAHKRIIFNGNGYSDEWVAEAERRGLPNIRSMVDAIPALTTDKAVKLFEAFGVFTRAELESRSEVEYENYSKAINIEARTMYDMASKSIIPAVIKYTTQLASSIAAVKGVCQEADVSTQTELLIETSKLLAEIKTALARLLEVTEKAAAAEGGKVQALVYHSQVVPAMEALRAPVDQLEMIVDKELWPMPSYGDLIFEV